MAYSVLWKIHAILMSVSFLSLTAGILISILFKKKKWRYNTHRKLGITAGAAGITAFLIAFIMIQLFSGPHFSSLHTLAGGISVLLLIITPQLGLNMKKAANKKRIKLIHRIFGGLTFTAMAFTILLGLRFVGIL